MIVLDTSALVRWLLEPEKLTPEAEQAISSSRRRVISSISIWEIALKVSRARLVLPMTLDQFVKRLDALSNFEVIDVNTRTWLESAELAWDHADPADRVIVALASEFSCPLVSSDRRIALFYDKTVW